MLGSPDSPLVRLLRWSEKYTKTDMVYLAHGSFWLSSSALITAGVSFVLALAFANLFTPHEYGIYKYILTLFGILCVACLRGMDTVVTQGAARGNDGTVTLGLRSKMRWGLFGSLGALCIAAYYFYGGNYPVAWAMLLAAVFVPLMEPLGIFNSVLVGKKDFKLSSMLGILGHVVAVTLLSAALFVTDNPVFIFATYCTSWTLTRYISLRYTRKKYPPNDKIEPGALSYALHSSFINTLGVLVASLDSILIYHYLGAAELALYAFAMAPVAQARAILNNPTILAVPKLAGQSTKAISSIMARRTWSLAGLGIVLMLGYWALAYPFFFVFFPQYVNAVPFSLAFSITIFTQVTSSFVGAALESRATLVPKRLLYLWNIPGIFIAVCAIFLIPIIGLWGAILGQLLMQVAGFIITWVIWRAVKDKELEGQR